MIEIARVVNTSTALPRVFFDRWCDLDTHPQWAPGMEWFRLDEPFGVGARGRLKLREGRESPFYVSAIIDGRVYEDTTVLDAAELIVRHEAISTKEGSRLELTAALVGPRAQHFADEFGDISAVLAADLASLIRLVESEAAHAPAAVSGDA